MANWASYNWGAAGKPPQMMGASDPMQPMQPYGSQTTSRPPQPTWGTNRPPGTDPPEPSGGAWTPAWKPTGQGSFGGGNWYSDAGNDIWVNGVKYGHSGGWSGMSNMGVAVGRSAKDANPDRPGMSWRDIAGMMGITDWQGPKDPRKDDVINAYWGNVNPGAVGGSTTRLEYATRLRDAASKDPRIQSILQQYGADQYGYKDGQGGHGSGLLGGGGGGGGSTTASSTPGSGNYEDIMQGLFTNMMTGKESAMNEGVVSRMKGQALAASEGGYNRARQQATEDAIERGMGRSGELGANLMAARSAANSQYAQQSGDILNQKATADYQAKVTGLERAQAFLDSKRQYLLQSAKNQNDLTLGLKQIELGQARLDQEMQLARDQMAQQEAMQRASMGAAGSAAAADREWQREMWERELPFRMAGLYLNGMEGG